MDSTTQPRYAEIEEWLADQCKVLAPGALLPSEHDLASQFGVSRMTARQAVQNLAKLGVVERRRGAGTFVAPRTLHRREGVLMSFTDDMRRRGMSSHSRVLRAEVTTSPREAESLSLDPTALVVRLDRVRFANDIPLAIERVTLPGEFAAVLEHDMEHESLHVTLQGLGRQLSHAQGYVSARLATAEEANIMSLTLPAALLVESRVIYDHAGRPVERTETCYIADRWVIDNGSFAAREG